MPHDEYVEDVKRYSDMVFRIALHSCANKEDAEDILQNVFLKLLQNKKNFNSEEHKKSWLIRVTVNEWILHTDKTYACERHIKEKNEGSAEL